MGFLDRLNRLLGLYGSAIKHSLRFNVWWPFFIYFIMQLILLFSLAHYTNPYIYPILEPIVSLFGGDRAAGFSHYPGLFMLLPFYFQMIKIGLGVIFEGLAVGLTTILFVRAYMKSNSEQYSLSIAFNNWPNLLIGWTIITGILFVINWYFPQMVEPYLIGSPRRMLMFEVVMRIATVGIYSLFVYALPLIVMRKINALAAIGKSFRIFAGMPFFSFFLAFIAYLVTLLFGLPATQGDIIKTLVTKFAPELVFYLLIGMVFMDMIVNVIFTGALTRFLIDEND